MAVTKATLQIVSKDAGSGSRITTNITYINPAATDTQLKTLAQSLNGLTTNTLVSMSKVLTMDIVAYDYTVTAATTTPTIAVGQTTTSVALTTDIPNPGTVTWDVSASTGLTVSVNYDEDTSELTATFSVTTSTAATYTATIIPKINGTQVADTLSFTVTRN